MTAQQVTFTRIGRRRDVPPLPVRDDASPDDIAEAVFQHARKYLASKWFDVTLGEDGAVWIEGGRFGTGRLEPVAS